MNTQLISLRLNIQECTACTFRNQDITPLAPALVKTLVNVMFIGENPSWAENQTEPFSSSTISGDALDKYYLMPLGLIRSQVWITDLFKCRYPKAIYHTKSHNENLIQSTVEICTNKWLVSEIHLAQPKVIVTLSDKQVYQRLRKAFSLSTPAEFSQAVGKPYSIIIGQMETILFPMIHPDISRPIGEGDKRKENARKKWAYLHSNVHVPELKKIIESRLVS